MLVQIEEVKWVLVFLLQRWNAVEVSSSPWFRGYSSQAISYIALFFFSTGFCVSAARLGLPDVGLISYGEMVDQGRLINEAVSIPVIGDGDNGYGNSMNIKRTIKGYINAGFAGIMLEDQVRSFRNTNQSFHRLAP